ncbi:uncharacterized protein LOC126657803 [Mercurialis annua]|uniref:uncharacterized protein LOC126657803 n=1 Tax=Mercurialis annua TaxID=3986 RepID=UPI00215F9F22|nr:uncharacterized protein LOC126657803 [Mercurialis annua]
MEKLEANSDQNHIEEDPNFKFWPCEDTVFKCEIAKAEKIIRDMDRKQAELLKAMEKLKIEDIGSVYPRLNSAMWEDWCAKKSMDREQKCGVEPLKQALDKICFRNKAYQTKYTKSCFSDDEEGVHFRNLKFKIRHGNKSMAAEKRLLKKGNKLGSQEREACNNIFTDLIINKQIFSLDSYSYADEDTIMQIREKFKQLELKREKALTNAIVEGKNWRKILGSKQEIQEKINHHELRIEESRKERLKNSCCIKDLKKKLKAIEKDVLSLESQMEGVSRQRKEAYNLQRLLVNQHEEKDRCCFQHLANLNNGGKIVQKKDVTGSPVVEYRAEKIIEMIANRYGINTSKKTVPYNLSVPSHLGFFYTVPVRHWPKF